MQLVVLCWYGYNSKFKLNTHAHTHTSPNSKNEIPGSVPSTLHSRPSWVKVYPSLHIHLRFDDWKLSFLTLRSCNSVLPLWNLPWWPRARSIFCAVSLFLSSTISWLRSEKLPGIRGGAKLEPAKRLIFSAVSSKPLERCIGVTSSKELCDRKWSIGILTSLVCCRFFEWFCQFSLETPCSWTLWYEDVGRAENNCPSFGPISLRI